MKKGKKLIFSFGRGRGKVRTMRAVIILFHSFLFDLQALPPTIKLHIVFPNLTPKSPESLTNEKPEGFANDNLVVGNITSSI